MLRNKKGIIYIPIGILLLILVIIFIFRDNNGNVKPVEEPITYHLVLNGESDVIVYQNSLYEELGFKAYDSKGNDYTDNVLVTGFVDTNVVGEYKLIYTYDKYGLSATRTVTVVSRPTSLTYLFLNGEDVIYLPKGKAYEEPGYNVFDSNNSNLVNEVKVTGTVDSSKAGTYTLVYSVTNDSGVTVTTTRTVVVVGATVNISHSPNNTTNKNVTISISVEDNYFDYILLPDGNKVNVNNYNYSVSSNGTYTFSVYSKYGDPITKTVKVSNIDKSKPSGSCSGYYKNNKSYITISAKDNIGINRYTINGQTISLKDGVYVHNASLPSANVQVYDKAGNSKSFSCILENKNEYTSKNQNPEEMKVYKYSSKSYGNMAYWLYVPKNASKNMPVIIFLHGAGELGHDYDGGQNAIKFGIGNDIAHFGSAYNAIVIMPQSRKDTWTKEMIFLAMEIINYVVDTYDADRNRISIAGFSNGCRGLGSMAERYPGYFSAYVPIECFPSTSSISYYLNTPVWIFSSQEYNHNGSIKFINELNKQGGNGKEYYMKGNDHLGLVGNKKNFSMFRDKEIDLVNWMISQRKK